MSLVFLFIVLTDKTCHTVPMILVTNSCFVGISFTFILFWMIMFTLYNDLQQIYYQDLFCNFREMNKHVTLVNRLLRAKKELKMVFRIVILISICLILGIPYTIFVLMRFFTLPPEYHFRIAVTFIEMRV
ncbi:unnamed protein product, partial [Adineta steineri]